MAAGLILLFVYAVLYRHDVIGFADRFMARVRVLAPVLAGCIVAALVTHALVFGAFSVGGSDAFGYVNQAYEWKEGQLPGPIPVTLQLPFATTVPMQAPLGYKAGPEPGTIVPTYAPGLPLLMAATLIVGSCGPFFVVPVFAGLFIYFTYALGKRAAGPATGVVSALVTAAAPIVLFQTIWPMSDVPAGATWTAAALFSQASRRRDAAVSGLWTALAVFIRPNLAPLAAVPGAAVALSAVGRERWTRIALFVAPIVPVAVAVAALNAKWYGSPVNSGYGSAEELYMASNIWPNLKLYASWLWESQSPWVLLALLPLVPRVATGDRRVVALCVALCAGTLACYASYFQFDAWWYLRFLLPAYGAFGVLIALGLRVVARAIPDPFGRIASAGALGVFVTGMVAYAAHNQVFGGLRAGERRYVDIGQFAAHHLPRNAVLFAVQHSGNLRFYAGRPTVRFDWIEPERAADVVPTLERAGYHPYLVIDDFETPSAREKFRLAPDAALPWPITARMRELGGITVYDMATNPAPVSPVAIEPGGSPLCAPRRPVTALR